MGSKMINDKRERDLDDGEVVVPCFSLSEDDSYLISASGGVITLYNMQTFETMRKFMAPPPSTTCLAFYPRDNDIVAIGMEDSSILIYSIGKSEVKHRLEGHEERITGLVFSNNLKVLVSSGADLKVCVWSMNGWEQKFSKSFETPAKRIQFDVDQTHLLIVRESQIAIYEAPKLDYPKHWSPGSGLAIMDATHSHDSQSIYAALEDGSVQIFDGILGPRCLLTPHAYLNQQHLRAKVIPVAITAHPSKPDQFTVGLTDGVYIVEPAALKRKWGD